MNTTAAATPDTPLPIAVTEDGAALLDRLLAESRAMLQRLIDTDD